MIYKCNLEPYISAWIDHNGQYAYGTSIGQYILPLDGSLWFLNGLTERWPKWPYLSLAEVIGYMGQCSTGWFYLDQSATLLQMPPLCHVEFTKVQGHAYSGVMALVYSNKVNLNILSYAIYSLHMLYKIISVLLKQNVYVCMFVRERECVCMGVYIYCVCMYVCLCLYVLCMCVWVCV